jgi:hypothetical protein
LFVFNFTKNLIIQIILLCISLSVSAPLSAIEEPIQQIQTVYFGSVITRLGSCEMDAVTGSITSSGNICIGSETLGHYRITGDPNEVQEITFSLVTDLSRGIQFAPKGRLVNNLGDDMLAPIAGAKYSIMLGSDGLLDIYVGGTLTFTKIQNNNSGISLNYDIESITP